MPALLLRRVMAGLLGAVVLGATVASGPAVTVATAASDHTVTFVNKTGTTIWVGSTVNYDGSLNLTGLPTLRDGESATITVPESAGPGHWRGKFFARQGCTGNSGGDFHCEVGDCGPYADHCSGVDQPVSLAEFNFDPPDSLAPWYNVSYVNAFSVPITIDTVNASPPPPPTNSCSRAGCPEDILGYCPAADRVYGSNGVLDNCVNPDRDALTGYTDALKSKCPRAYFWSKQDTEPGNQTVFQCAKCGGFTVTFNG